MGASHKELLRLVAILAKQQPLEISDGCVRIGPPARQVCIRLSPERSRYLGILAVPVTDVEIEFRGFDEAAQAEFMAEFDRVYQRGGG
jgi:hypothetical protein